MDKDGNVKDRIGIEMMDLDPIVKKKATDEITCGEGQSAFNKVLKQNYFIGPLIRPLITSRRTPLDNHLRLEEALIN